MQNKQVNYYQLLCLLIAAHHSRRGVEEIEDKLTKSIVAKMINNGEVFRSRGKLYITHRGRQVYEAAMDDPQIRLHTGKWKDEALTGITPSGRRSRINDAAIPRGAEIVTHKNNQEDLIVALLDKPKIGRPRKRGKYEPRNK